MAIVNIYEAKTQLSKLLKRVRAGQEIVIADAGTPVAKLVPIETPPGPRVLGLDRGKVWIAPDAFEPMMPAEVAEWEAGPLFPPRPVEPPRRSSRGAKSRTGSRRRASKPR